MNFGEWLSRMFAGQKVECSADTIAAEAASIAYRKLAIEACITYYANSLSVAEFQTFEEGKAVRGEEYYRLNIEPNEYENAPEFWRRVVSKLFHENEALILLDQAKFYLAESFRFDDGSRTYRDVVFPRGKEQKRLTEQEVLRITWRNERLGEIVDGIYSDTKALLTAVKDKTIRDQLTRLFVEVPTSYPQTEKAQASLNTLINSNLKAMLTSKSNTVGTLTNGLKISEVGKTGGSAGSGSGSSASMRSTIEDYLDYVAIAVGIPPQLIKGGMADLENATNNFIAFGLNPLCRNIDREFNRKYYRMGKYKKRTYMSINTTYVGVASIKEIAGSLDLLLRCGTNSVDDNLTVLGREPLNTAWSTQHWMTKNYENIELMLKEGGNNARQSSVRSAEQ